MYRPNWKHNMDIDKTDKKLNIAQTVPLKTIIPFRLI